MGIRSVYQPFHFSRGLLINASRKSNVSIGQAVDSGLWDQYMPFYDVDSPDVRCGRGASTSGPGTKTAVVRAGDEVGFVIGRSANEVENFIFLHK